ncbi:MAG: hypothetical protein JSW04_07165 [Desulfobacterales bacterium]|nr:MAG: hypothetical protein JSV38_00470 [Desulfobacterales bacterium]UCD91193.1 MAG: hypothetical protein JSW04_07165 [Desulfobacterales bacterium]
MRHELKKQTFVWQKKRRRSGDRGKRSDRRRKIKDGIIIQDYERRQEAEPQFKGPEKRSGEDRRSGKDRRK